MNKKILFLILLASVFLFPLATSAAAAPDIILKVKDAFVTVGSYIVIMGWIIAAILYLTAAGNPEQLKLAKNALVAAVIGTVLIVLAVTAEPTIKELLGV